MALLRTTAPRILDFDCENRPLSYSGQDFTTPELTAIAWSFGRGVEVRCLGEWDGLLEEFLDAYALADIVTGHNILKHDLRLINATLLEQGQPPLPPKLICDTYTHLKKRSPGFASQATLAAMLGVRAPKVAMSTPAWRSANRLTSEGIEKTRKRVTGDVRQHIQLRKRLLELGWLNPPVPWHP